MQFVSFLNLNTTFGAGKVNDFFTNKNIELLTVSDTCRLSFSPRRIDFTHFLIVVT